MSRIEVARGVALHVAVRGVGPPVVMLHGFTADHTTMAVLTDRLVSDHRVIVPDLVGHGRSSSPPSAESHSVDAMVDHVATLAAELDAVPFHLVGYSMGGRVALTLACAHPSQVRSLSLIGASAGLADPEERRQRRVADGALADELESAGIEAFVDRWMANPLFATQDRLGTDFLAAARAQRLANDPVALARSLRGAGTGAMGALHERLAHCAVPTVLIAGADDHKFTAIARDLAAVIPSADVVVVEAAGHAAHLEQPDAVAEAIRRRIGE